MIQEHQPREHFFYLSFLRVLAAIIVLTCHARVLCFETYSQLDTGSQNLFTKGLFGITSITEIAMSFFFVLSGFLVGGPVVNNIIDYNFNKSSDQLPEYTRKFTINRFSRIIPPLFFAIILAIIVKEICGTDWSCIDAIKNIFGLQGVVATDFGGVFWSLAYEMWFYVLLAGCLLVFCKRWLSLLGMTVIIMSGFIFLTLNPIWLFALMIGTLAYFLRKKVIPFILMGLALLVMSGSHIIYLLTQESKVSNRALYGVINSSIPLWIIVISVAFIIIMLCGKQPSGRGGMLIESLGNRLAPITYSLYITHYSILLLFNNFLGKAITINGLSMLLYFFECLFCIGFSYLFYRFIEKPISKKFKTLAS